MKKLLVLLVLAFSLNSFSQDKIKLSFYQDAKLATIDDGHGNEPFTLDFLFKFKMTGKQQEFGYMVISPIFEYAEIEGVYKRYAVDLGYTFNKLILDDFEATASINYGIQERWSKAFLVFGSDFELGYKITDNISINLLAQFVQRKDLEWAYGIRVIRCSGFIGLTFTSI
tara:strand:- start:1906 stop:2415 length:510 start_codon:yes stop_codon:yes gene_type:complete